MRLYDYAGSANCYKIKLLLSRLGLEYETVDVEIFRGESRTPDFLKKNPAGRVPVLELPSGECLAESNAILCYLAAGTDLFPSPSTPDARLTQARILQWLFFEQYEIEPTVGTVRFWKLTGRDKGQAELFAAKQGQAQRALVALDRHLAERTFVVADTYTVADIALYAYAHVAAEGGLEVASLGAFERWVARVEEQPGWIPGPAPYSALAHIV
ncbi:MAG TPA: glutathione S-transferase family protein [Polyangiaceae bacterium]|nr:glutathione S-transferase family protein [Polyangiaceae bacterium]